MARHKHCDSVRLPSSSKGCGFIRYTGEINSSAPEKSRTQPAHLPVHKTHLLTLQRRLASACLALLSAALWRAADVKKKKKKITAVLRFVFNFAFAMIFLNISTVLARLFFSLLLLPGKIMLGHIEDFQEFSFLSKSVYSEIYFTASR